MTDPTRPKDLATPPPLNLDAIERRLANRTPKETATRQARLDTWLLGRDAMAIGEHHLAAGDLTRAREFFAIAARHDAADARTMLDTVGTLLTAANDPAITSITTGTALESDLVDTQAERDLVVQRAQDLTRQLDQVQDHVDRVIGEAEAKAAAIIDKAHEAARAIAAAEKGQQDTTVRDLERKESRLITGWHVGSFSAFLDLSDRERLPVDVDVVPYVAHVSVSSSDAPSVGAWLEMPSLADELNKCSHHRFTAWHRILAKFRLDSRAAGHTIPGHLIWQAARVGVHGTRACSVPRSLVGEPVESLDVLAAIGVLGTWISQFTSADRDHVINELEALLDDPEKMSPTQASRLLLPSR